MRVPPKSRNYRNGGGSGGGPCSITPLIELTCRAGGGGGGKMDGTGGGRTGRGGKMDGAGGTGWGQVLKFILKGRSQQSRIKHFLSNLLISPTASDAQQPAKQRKRDAVGNSRSLRRRLAWHRHRSQTCWSRSSWHYTGKSWRRQPRPSRREDTGHKQALRDDPVCNKGCDTMLTGAHLALVRLGRPSPHPPLLLYF